MTGKVLSGGEASEPFEIANGIKQGCVSAPVLFNLFFTCVISRAVRDIEDGVYIRQRNKRARSGRLRGHIMSMACWSLCSQRRDWLLKKGFKWGLPGFQLGAKDSLDTIAGDDEFLAQEQSQAFRHWRRSNAPVLGVKAERPMVISSTSGYRWKRKWRDRKVASKQKQKMRHEKRKLRKMGMSPKQRGSIILPATSIMPRVPSFVKGGSRRGSKLPFSRQGSSQGSGAVTSVPFSASQPGSQTSSVHSRASEASKSSTRQHHQPHHPPPAPVLTVFNPSASPASDASQNTAAFHEKNVNSQPTAGASVVVQSASKTTSPSDSSKNVNLHHTAGASVVVHLASKTTSSSPSSASPLTSSQSSPSLPNHVNKPSVHEKPVVKTVAETTNSSSLPSTVIQVNQSNIQESASPGTSPEGSQPPEPADGELVDGTAVNITMQPGTSLQSATVQVLPRVVEKHHADQSSTPLLKGSSNATKAVRRGSTGNNSPPSARCSSGKPAVSGKKSATSNELPNKLHPNPKAKQRAEKSRSNREATSVDSVSLSSETPLTDLVYFIWESPPK
ncbi:hypothetical protein ACOMHN_007014 [Nucella lapillus]